jgi:hypothetical protein
VYKIKHSKNHNNLGNKSEVPASLSKKLKQKRYNENMHVKKNLTNIQDIPSYVYGEGDTINESSLDGTIPD